MHFLCFQDRTHSNAADRRPMRYWDTFNTWWRAHLSETNKRPTPAEIHRWYEQNHQEAWESFLKKGFRSPGVEATIAHAKCLRSTDSIRDYFRAYRARKRGEGQDSGCGNRSSARGYDEGDCEDMSTTDPALSEGLTTFCKTDSHSMHSSVPRSQHRNRLDGSQHTSATPDQPGVVRTQTEPGFAPGPQLNGEAMPFSPVNMEEQLRTCALSGFALGRLMVMTQAEFQSSVAQRLFLAAAQASQLQAAQLAMLTAVHMPLWPNTANALSSGHLDSSAELAPAATLHYANDTCGSGKHQLHQHCDGVAIEGMGPPSSDEPQQLGLDAMTSPPVSSFLPDPGAKEGGWLHTLGGGVQDGPDIVATGYSHRPHSQAVKDVHDDGSHARASPACTADRHCSSKMSPPVRKPCSANNMTERGSALLCGPGAPPFSMSAPSTESEASKNNTDAADCIKLSHPLTAHAAATTAAYGHAVITMPPIEQHATSSAAAAAAAATFASYNPLQQSQSLSTPIQTQLVRSAMHAGATIPGSSALAMVAATNVHAALSEMSARRSLAVEAVDEATCLVSALASLGAVGISTPNCKGTLKMSVAHTSPSPLSAAQLLQDNPNPAFAISLLGGVPIITPFGDAPF